MERGPRHQHCHDSGLTSAGCQLQGITEEVGGLGHAAAILDLIQIDDRLDGLLLSKKETLANRFALLLPLKPPFQQATCNNCCIGIARLPPTTNFVSEGVDEVVELFVRGRHVLEE